MDFIKDNLIWVRDVVEARDQRKHCNDSKSQLVVPLRLGGHFGLRLQNVQDVCTVMTSSRAIGLGIWDSILLLIWLLLLDRR